MAKDKNKADGDNDWDSWDEELSWDDDMGDAKDDRKPSTRFTIGAAKGAAKDLASIERLKDIAHKALPKGYGEALDVIDSGISSTQELYHDVVREVKPGIRNTKRYLADTAKQYKEKLPKFGKKVLEKWEKEAKEEDEQRAQQARWDKEREDGKDRELLAAVSEVLEGSAEQAAQHHAEDQARDDIKQDIADKRHAQTNKQMVALQEGLGRMVGFNNQFAARYMRKSLELKYRAFALQRAQFEHSKESTTLSLKLLEGIHKNSGLPDYVKATASERLRDMAFQKMFGVTTDMLGSFNQRFFGNIKKNIRDRVIGRIKNEVANAQNIMSAATSGRDSLSMMDGMGSEGDIAEFKGEMVGQGISGVAVPWLLGKGKDQLDKLAAKNPDSRLAKLLGELKDNGANLTYASRNIGKLIQQDLRDNLYGSNETGVKGMLKRWGRRGLDMAVDYDTGRRYSVANMRPDDLIKPAQFDNMTYRSLNEVIPGLLTKILHSTEGIRTGEDDPDSAVYDNVSGTFVSQKRQVQHAKEQLFRKGEFSNYASSMSSIMRLIDPKKTLSDRARNAMVKQLIRDADANIPYDPKHYTDASNFDKSIDKEAVDELINYFKTRYGIVDDVDKNGFSKQVVTNKNQYMREREMVDQKYGDVSRWQPDIQRQLNVMANTGDREALRKLGILKNQDGLDRVDHDRYFAELDRYIDNPEYGRRANVDSMVRRSATRGLGGSTIVGGRDPKNTAQLRELNRTLQNFNPGANNSADSGYGKWWNESGVITGSLEEQIRAWQEIQLEATQEAADQRTAMLELLGALVENAGHGGADSGEGHEGIGSRIRGLGQQAWKSRLGRGARWAGRKGKQGLFALGRFMKNRLVGDAMRVINAQRWMWNKVTGGARKLQDVYVKGESEPRLLASKMRQGLYIDSTTQKVIKSLSDIKGPVLDDEGNILIGEDDLKKGLVNRWGRAMDEGGLRKWLNDAHSGVRRLLSVGTYVGKAKNLVMDYLDRVEDIYVRGESTPRLLALVINNGGYFRKSDGKVIKHYTDIDGDIVDAQGNVVLTLADMTKGMVNKHGKPLRRAMDKIRDAAMKVVTLPLDLMRKSKNLVVGLGKAAKNAMKGLGKWWNDRSGVQASASIAMADRLQQIYELLDERMPGHARDYRDSNGDGVRDGSLEDLRRKRAERDARDKKNKDIHNQRKGKKGEKGEEGEGKGLLGGLMDMIGNTKIGGMLKRLMGGPLGKILGGVGGMLSGSLGLGKGLLQVGGGAARLLGGGVGMLARGGLALGGTALAAAGGWAGLGALLFNPITLGIAAVALAGYGAWKLYKHFADKPDPMQKMRLYAYGARGDDSDFNGKLLKMETYLVEQTKSTGGGSYVFDPKTDAKELFKIWEIDAKDQDRVAEWMTWFNKRFTPVYVKAFKLWKEQFPDAKKFMEMDSEPDGIAKVQWSEQFIIREEAPTGPYYIEANPLGHIENARYIAGPGVLSLMEKELENIKKKYGKETAKLTQEQASARWSKMSEAQRKAQTPYALAGQKAADRFNDMDYRRANGERKRQMDATAVIESVDRRGRKWVTGGKIDALTALRIRIYGLKVPMLSQIQVLMDLERAVEPSVTKQGDKAVFTGDLNKLYQEFAARFDRSPTEPNDQKIWVAWMTKRFLPVYVTLVSEAQKHGVKGLLDEGLQNLKDRERFEIAQALMAVTYLEGKDKLSVWTWNSCGFKGVAANTESTTTLPQTDALKALADKEKVREENGEASDKEEQLNEKTMADRLTRAGFVKMGDGTWGKASSTDIARGRGMAAGSNPGAVASSGGGFTGYSTNSMAGMPGADGLKIDTGNVDEASFRKPARGAGPEKGRRLLIKAAVAHGITDPQELAVLLANVEHESLDYKYAKELNYTKPETLLRVFPKYFRSLQDAKDTIALGNKAVFERVYGGRNGNDKPGDGARYIGRGNIQITGKANYARIGKLLQRDLVSNPEWLETPEGAAEGSVAWWLLNPAARKSAKANDPALASRSAVNGGTNGIQDVRSRWASWQSAIKTGELQRLIDEAKSSPTTPAGEAATTTATEAKPESAASITDVGYAASAAPSVPGAAPAANATAAQTTQAARQDGGASAPSSATEGGAPLAAAPTVSSFPTNPGAGRGVGPATPGPQQAAATTQQQQVSTPSFTGVEGILKEQLKIQQAIAKNTENTALKMDDLISAVKGVNFSPNKSGSGSGSQGLQARPQGISPTRTRYQ